MATFTNKGIDYLAKVGFPEGFVSIGFNENGMIRRYEDGELIGEFKSIDEYNSWVKENRPDEYCPDVDTLPTKKEEKAVVIKEFTAFSDPVTIHETLEDRNMALINRVVFDPPIELKTGKTYQITKTIELSEDEGNTDVSVELSRETLDRLDKIGCKDENYDQIINRILDEKQELEWGDDI